MPVLLLPLKLSALQR